jgi:hypothetical protein
MSREPAHVRPLFSPPASSAAHRLEQALALYRKRIARCRTENQRNFVHIALENFMTPLEVHYFHAAFASDAPESPARRWIASVEALTPAQRHKSADFERRGLIKGATLYTADALSPREKTLVLAFGGQFHRLLVPTPSLLASLDARHFDVVLLRDFSRRYFATGIRGLGEDFFTAVAELARQVVPSAYRSSVALGTSAGGLPALLAAMQLRLDRGIFVGGIDFAHFAHRLSEWGVDARPYADLLASRPQPFPELLLVYCVGNPIDARSAIALHSQVPSHLLGLRNCNDHNVFRTKLMRGQLPSFLSKLLCVRGSSASTLFPTIQEVTG